MKDQGDKEDEARWVHVTNADIFVAENGDRAAPALMLFSGARCNTNMWTPVLAELAGSFHIIRHDVRGTGRSRLHDRANLGLDRYADDAAAILDDLGISNCVAWGMAFGSRVALAFAARHPAYVSALALYDASVEPPDPDAQRESVARAKDQRRRLGIPEYDWNREWLRNDDPDSLAAALRGAYVDSDHRRYAAHVSAPTLIATGDLDPNLAASRRLSQMIAGSEMIVLNATGHGSVLQRPDLCVSELERFLARLPSTKTEEK